MKVRHRTLSPRAVAVTLVMGALACGGRDERGISGTDNDGSGVPASALPELRDIDAAGIRALVTESEAPLLLLNVWATWCLPCVAEFPDLVRLGRDFEDRGLRVVFVSADFEESAPAAREFLRDQGVDTVSYRKKGGDEAFIEALSPEWSGALPGTFLYRSGKLIHGWEGKQSYEEFERRILAAFENR